MKVVNPFSVVGKNFHHFSTTFAKALRAEMIHKTYKYAKYILDEALAPRAWRTKSLRRSIYYIHDYALALLWREQKNALEEFFDRIGRFKFHIPPVNNKYPDYFVSNTFEFEYTSFQLALGNEPKNTLLYLTVIGLDIYCMSGRVLHNLANSRAPSATELMELKKTCLLLEETGANVHFYADRVLRTAPAKSPLLSTSTESMTPPPLQEATPKGRVKDDYINIFLEALQLVSSKKPLAYADVVALLGQLHPRKTPYQGKIMCIYFENGYCFVKKRIREDREYTEREDRTLQNYYTDAKKIHKIRFCEK